jgi:hypothetical protein
MEDEKLPAVLLALLDDAAHPVCVTPEHDDFAAHIGAFRVQATS